MHPDTELSIEERDNLVERVADEVTKRGLTVPAVLFLEMNRPLTFLASQALVVFTPLLGVAFGPQNLEKLALMMQDRRNLDLLITAIESRAPAPSQRDPAPGSDPA